uniref:Uncharacterized protein n=1 Tax=Romanomermis culicivorax TaxID=13658 RepID=A0A915L4Z2_ROMCU
MLAVVLKFFKCRRSLNHPSMRKSSKTETKAKFYQGDIILTENQRRILGLTDRKLKTHETDKPHAALTADLSLKWNLPIRYIFNRTFYG